MYTYSCGITTPWYKPHPFSCICQLNNGPRINKEDLITYVETKLQKTGRITPLFDSNAYEALDSYAQGSTRKLNNLISQVLMMGALQNKQEITAENIFQANNEMTII